MNAYQTVGVKGLKGARKNRSYSVEFKLKAITMYEASEKSYQTVANVLGLNNPSLIARWRQVYHERGIAGLSRQQGRPSMSNKKQLKKEKQTNSQYPKISDLEEANKRIE